MRANKVFFDIYSTSGGRMPHAEYCKWYDKHDTVYIVLVDCKIYTKVKRQVMFDKGMNYGCLIEHEAYDTPEQVERHALAYAEAIGAVEVSNDDFIRIEKEKEQSRVRRAFAIAEQMIREG